MRTAAEIDTGMGSGMGSGAANPGVPYIGEELQDDLAFLAAARAADKELCALVNQANRTKVLQSGVLERISLARYYSALGFPNLRAYAVDRGVEPTERKARELCALEAHLERLPDIRAAYLAGEFDWTKVRDIATAVTPETQGVWLERLRDGWTNRQLEDKAREVRGLPAIRRIMNTVTPEVGVLYDQVVADVVRTAGRALEDEEIFEAILLRALHGGGSEATAESGDSGASDDDPNEADTGESGARKRSRRAKTRIVIDHCPDCGRNTIEGRHGPVEISDALYAKSRCDSEILDIQDGPAPVSRTIPPKVGNYVLGRDHNRCQVKGCKNQAFVEIHHEGGWQVVGHDPDFMFTLCTQHHMALHRRELRIEGRGRDRRFLLPDGTEAGAHVGSTTVPHVGSTTVPHVGSTTVPHVGSSTVPHVGSSNITVPNDCSPRGGHGCRPPRGEG